METIFEVIDMLETTYEIKLMEKPYRFNPKPFRNMNMQKHCEICNRIIGLYEMVIRDKQNHIVCQQCHYEHIAHVNLSSYRWFKKTYIDINEELSPNWLPVRESDLVELTHWLTHYTWLKNTVYVAIEKADKHNIPRLSAVYLPQSHETLALNIWLNDVGINTTDCTFRTLDTFPSFKNSHEDIMVIYNDPRKTHSNKNGLPLNMKLNPISKIFGENIMGTVVFMHKSLLVPEVFVNTYKNDYIKKRDKTIC
jgi:hypothetical protein